MIESIEMTRDAEAAWEAYKKPRGITKESCPSAGKDAYDCQWSDFIAGILEREIYYTDHEDYKRCQRIREFLDELGIRGMTENWISKYCMLVDNNSRLRRVDACKNLLTCLQGVFSPDLLAVWEQKILEVIWESWLPMLLPSSQECRPRDETGRSLPFQLFDAAEDRIEAQVLSIKGSMYLDTLKEEREREAEKAEEAAAKAAEKAAELLLPGAICLLDTRSPSRAR